MWQESILDRQIKPAAEQAGLGAIGWHTFRHSYRSWLKRTNAPIEHANIQTTLDTYGKEDDVSELHQEAHKRVVKMILQKERVCEYRGIA